MTATGPDTQPLLTEQVAEEIRALLARRRISGRELARRLGTSHSWVGFRLTGAQPIDLNELQRIAVVLGVDAADLMPRTVVSAAGPVRQTTVPDSDLPIRSHLFGRPSHQIPASSTRRTARLSLAHA